MIQQSHFWVYVQWKFKHYSEDISVLPHSLQQHLQQPKYGNNLSICQQTNGSRKRGVYICARVHTLAHTHRGILFSF